MLFIDGDSSFTDDNAGDAGCSKDCDEQPPCVLPPKGKLSSFLHVPTPPCTKPKAKVQTGARVLTSREFLSAMEEKERQKREATEEKERKRRERAEKLKAKKEEKAQKAKAREGKKRTAKYV